MGYTHYFTQTRDFNDSEWQQICEDIGLILKDVEHVQGIPLADWQGAPKSRPEIDDESVSFNGLGNDGHETFIIRRKRLPKEPYQTRRGSDFCKTARKPYDLAVTASLCYLATTVETHDTSSDGQGADWLAGLEEAKRALPRYSNQLDIPMPILQADRWQMPWIQHAQNKYEFQFCIDGTAYIFETTNESRCYCFPGYVEAAKFAAEHADIFNPSGMFDTRRNRSLAKQQSNLLRKMIDAAPMCGRNQRPPAFVRPGDILEPAKTSYHVTDLLNMLDPTTTP